MKFLKGSIASLAAVGSLAVGVTHAADNPLHGEQVVITCAMPDCEEAVAPIQPQPTQITVPAPPEIVAPAAANRVRNEPLRPQLEGRLQQVPSLPELGALFPSTYGDWQRQLDYIGYLDQEANVSVDDYHNFRFDDSFIGAFAGNSEYQDRITPQLIIPHWTVHRYPPGREGGQLFATGLLNHTRNGEPNPLSSNYFIDHGGTAVYRYYDEDTHMTAGALGMNEFGINVELEAGLAAPTDSAPTVLYDVQPRALEQMILTVVQLARRYNLAINEYTVVGHLAGDMLFVNHTFNPETGTVESMRKFDMPPELVTVIIRKADLLDRQLG